MTTPFGGYKLSGFGGHDKALHAHDQYTETKTIWIALKPVRRADMQRRRRGHEGPQAPPLLRRCEGCAG